MTTQVPALPADGEQQDRHSTGDDVICPQCGVVALTAQQCKRVCQQCGYVESCEDNFIPNMANPREDGVVLREPKNGR